MKSKKYKLLKDDSIDVLGLTLHRIEALMDFGNVKEGDLGGYIEKEANLSHEGNCWVYDKAKVSYNAQVSINAQVYNTNWLTGTYSNYDIVNEKGIFRLNTKEEQERYMLLYEKQQ